MIGSSSEQRRPVRFSGVPCRTTQPCPASSYRLSSSQMVQKFSLLLFMISVLVVIFTVALLVFFSLIFHFNLMRLWVECGVSTVSPAKARGASLDEKWIKVAAEKKKQRVQQQERANDLVNAVNKASFPLYIFLASSLIFRSCLVLTLVSDHGSGRRITDEKVLFFVRVHRGREWARLSVRELSGDLSASTPHAVRRAAECRNLI